MIDTTLWYSGKVLPGLQLSTKTGFPTVNIDPAIVNKNTSEGVYACRVQYQHTIYQGALYLGPKHIEDKNIQTLEIYIFHFNERIYDQTISFQLKKFIRPPLPFSSLEEVRRQLTVDVNKIKRLFKENKTN